MITGLPDAREVGLGERAWGGRQHHRTHGDGEMKPSCHVVPFMKARGPGVAAASRADPAEAFALGPGYCESPTISNKTRQDNAQKVPHRRRTPSNIAYPE
ncbi:hypothetical protein D3C83_29400 [compost metagenome]